MKSFLSLWLETDGAVTLITGSVDSATVSWDVAHKGTLGSLDDSVIIQNPSSLDLALKMAPDHNITMIVGRSWRSKFRHWLRSFPKP
jgi:hypothetical protein